MDSLKNQVAMVTVASSGIGRSIALTLAGQEAEPLLRKAKGQTSASAPCKNLMDFKWWNQTGHAAQTF